MEIPLICAECSKQNLTISSLPTIYNINESDFYEVTCEHGHTSYYFLQNEKFDILFNMAILALRDGYYREAILNFASALERFYEFGIRLMSEINNISKENTEILLYKQLKNASEKELGAYNALYLITRKIPAKNLSNKSRELRNGVVHQGNSPTFEKTLDYGDKVYKLIREDYFYFEKNYHSKISKIAEQRWEKTSLSTDKPLSHIVIPSFLTIENSLTIQEMIDLASTNLNVLKNIKKELSTHSQNSTSSTS